MSIKLQQEFTEIGLIGAALFIACPTLSIYLWLHSIAELAKQIDTFGAGSAFVTSTGYPVIAYVALAALSLIGLTMMIVGRIYRGDLPTAVAQGTQPTAKPVDDIGWR